MRGGGAEAPVEVRGVDRARVGALPHEGRPVLEAEGVYPHEGRGVEAPVEVRVADRARVGALSHEGRPVLEAEAVDPGVLGVPRVLGHLRVGQGADSLPCLRSAKCWEA